jgi:hypothetical protein
VSANIEGTLFQALHDLLSPPDLPVMWVIVRTLFDFTICIKHCR